MLRSALNFFGEGIATFFFVGRSPKAPGTCGSLAALPFAWLLWKLPPGLAWSIFFLIFVLGTWGASIVIRRTGVEDHQSIVIDEVLGIFLVTAVEPQYWKISFPLAFLLFRLFDIWKPWPVKWVDQKWKSALGTIMDDIMAALMAAVVLYAFLAFPSVMQSFGLPGPDCSYNAAAGAHCLQ